MNRTAVLPLLLALLVPPAQAAPGAVARVDAVADDWYAAMLAEQPELAYFVGVDPPRHDGLAIRSSAWLRDWEAREDAWLAALDAAGDGLEPGTPAWITHGVLREQFAAARQLRVCRAELWQGVNHMDSWHLTLATLAERQPVATAAHRAQALARWAKIPALLQAETANLREGLAQGYSAARPVAERMLQQLEGLLPAPDADETTLAQHPYAAPAVAAADDAAFRGEFLALLRVQVLPAMRAFRAFLAEEYLPRARAALAVSALPQGADCYRALLRMHTTLERGPQEVFALGQSVVEQHRAAVRALGAGEFGEADFAGIVRAVQHSPGNRFADPAELLPFSRELVGAAAAAMPRLVDPVPQQAVVVEPIPAFQDGAGASSHYEPPAGGRPGTYRISLLRPGGTLRGEAEITAFHETWPGHHLQTATAQRVAGLHPATKLLYNGGFVEGWARYAEELAEEAGLYRSLYARIQRRAWPARGMVVDPGIHALGWTREQAIEFLVESGRFNAQSAPTAVDRIAAIPAQLTAYDSGAQEFFALRRMAQAQLGPRFDLRRFHAVVLGSGSVTLPMLRTLVQRWVAQESAAGQN